MQDGLKAVWSIAYVSVAFFPSLKHNFIAYRSSKVSSCSDCIFEIDQLWQSGFSRVYSNCCCSCSFEPEIIKIGQSSHNMYSNNIVNFQEFTTILNACTKNVWKLIEGTRYVYLERERERERERNKHVVRLKNKGKKCCWKKEKKKEKQTAKNEKKAKNNGRNVFLRVLSSYFFASSSTRVIAQVLMSVFFFLLFCFVLELQNSVINSTPKIELYSW